MTKPPLYSRLGATSPTGGTDDTNIVVNGISQETGEVENTSSYQSLLDKAQQFSMFAVNHVEEVRQALLNTADTNFVSCNDSNSFGGKNSAEITAAFEELAAAYDKLSMVKWNAARIEYEEVHRADTGMKIKYPNGSSRTANATKVEKRVTVAGSKNAMMEARGLKDDPWQDDDMNPHDWISDAFLKAAIDEDEGEDSFPADGRLNAEEIKAASPPGFKSGKHVELLDADDHYDHTAKPGIRSFTSMGSEVSSLHTSSHYNDSHDEEDSDSDDYSDTSSSSDEDDLPSVENFDYVYKGGYAMQVSGGKETKGVVPKTVKRVLVDPSVKNIENGAFQGCNVLESITIPSTVEAVGDNAFRKCAKLKNVVFLTKGRKWNKKRDEKKEERPHRRCASAPSAVTEPRSSHLRSIGEWAFFNCSSLAAVKLPYGLQSIGARAFQRCSSMSITELPKTLVSVGENAFASSTMETKAAYDRWEKEQSS